MKADRPACICPGGMMNMVTKALQDVCGVYLPEAHTDARMMADLAKAIYDNDCFENYGVPFCMTVEAEALGATCTMGTQLFEPHVTGYAIDTVEDYKKLSPMDLNAGRAKVTLDAIRLLRAETKDVPIIGNIVGPVSVASSVCEPTRYYKQLRQKRELAHEYMQFVTDDLIRFALAMVEAGADVIALSDPSGTGEILGPKFFDEYAVFSRERNAPVFCGEFGCSTICVGQEERVFWYKTVTDLLDQKGIARTSWDYYGSFGIFHEKPGPELPHFPEDLNRELCEAMGFTVPNK